MFGQGVLYDISIILHVSDFRLDVSLPRQTQLSYDDFMRLLETSLLNLMRFRNTMATATINSAFVIDANFDTRSRWFLLIALFFGGCDDSGFARILGYRTYVGSTV